MNEHFHYRPASLADVVQLVELRLAFLQELSGTQEKETISQLRKSLMAYLTHALPNGKYICWLALDKETIAGVGGIAVWEKPGNFMHPNGRVGYVMSMYTLPSYRRKGICRALLEKLAASAKEQDVDVLELHATKNGEALYRQLGYHEPRSPYLELQL